MYMKKIFWAGAMGVALCFAACETEKKNPNFQQDAANAEFLHTSLNDLTRIVKHDIFPPMIAARIYTYANVAAWEALVAGSDLPNTPPQYVGYRSLVGQLKGLNAMPKPEAGKEYCYAIAAVKAYLKVGKALTFSEDSMTNALEKQMMTFKKIGIPKEIFERSVALGDTIGGAVIAWSKKDNYAQTRSMPKYSVRLSDPTRWRPTAPDYADAFEPHWNKIRTMVLDSASQFRVPPPPKFDSTKNSEFWKAANEVYETVKAARPEEIAIAKYWDDSPASTQNAGHVNMVVKKVTPGGHWLHIAQWSARQKNFNLMQSAEAYLMASLSIFDGFISCWDEKYRSENVRPETFINKYIAPEWSPVIVTPPFPEYTSGHSSISGASATVLNHFFGDNFSFRDSTEVQFGLGSRAFKNFNEAAEQAAASRLYGGIHYVYSNKRGLENGQTLAKFILSKIKTKK